MSEQNAIMLDATRLIRKSDATINAYICDISCSRTPSSLEIMSFIVFSHCSDAERVFFHGDDILSHRKPQVSLKILR